MTYTIQPSDLRTDRDCILGLWRENLPEASPDRYSWLYEDGPSAGWLVKKDREPTTVGSVGLMQRTVRVFGELLSAGQPIDLNIDAEHRTIGPALGLQRALTAAVNDGRFDLLYAFPNAASEPVQRRAGFRPLGTLQRWAKPLAVGKTLSAKLKNPLARRAAAALAAPALRLTSPETFYRRPADVCIDVAERFDERFDDLWETAGPKFPIIGERTSEFLSWRFTRCPDAQYRVLCLSNREGDLLAYLVFQERQGMVHIADLFFTEDRHVDTLLAEVIRLARKRKAEALIAVYLGGPAVSQGLKRFGFWQRPCQWKALLYADKQSHPPGSALFNPENWHLTHADIDTDD